MKKSFFAAVVCGLVLSGCAVGKYQPAAPSFTATPTGSCSSELVVMLKPVFPDKLISETVADNTVGVFWSAEESQNIGFTQRYASTMLKSGPQFAMLAALPATQRVGMSASGTMTPMNIDSRILVPFGRFISSNLKQALGANGQVCEDENCLREAIAARPKARVAHAEFSKVKVAEATRNMLMIDIEGTTTVMHSDGPATTVKISSAVNRSITSEGMFQSEFLKAMNKIANESSSAVVEQICAAGKKAG